MVVVEYFHVSVLLYLRLFKYLLWYSGSQNGTHAFPWAGFTAHTLAGSDVGSISHSSFAAKRRLPKSCEENDLMYKRTLRRLISVLAALAMGLFLLTGCGAKNAEQVQEQEDAQTIQVYLWSTSLYETYAPYVQSQLPDVNIEFIVGNNDLDFYKFLQENGGLPDIITCCRFSLHDAAPLKDSLMNLAMTNEAGAVYNAYLNSFKNEDGSVNWLPVCADAHGFVVNRSLFEQYDIPLPTAITQALFPPVRRLKRWASGALPPIIPTTTPAWKPCRGFPLPSLPRRKGASGALLTATPPAPHGWVWTTPCGRGHLNGWRSSFRIPTLRQTTLC